MSRLRCCCIVGCKPSNNGHIRPDDGMLTYGLGLGHEAADYTKVIDAVAEEVVVGASLCM